MDVSRDISSGGWERQRARGVWVDKPGVLWRHTGASAGCTKRPMIEDPSDQLMCLLSGQLGLRRTSVEMEKRALVVSSKLVISALAFWVVSVLTSSVIGH